MTLLSKSHQGSLLRYPDHLSKDQSYATLSTMEKPESMLRKSMLPQISVKQILE